MDFIFYLINVYSYFTNLVKLFLTSLHMALSNYGSFQLQYAHYFSFWIRKITFGFDAFHLDFQDIIHNCGQKNIINGANIYFETFYHNQNLPVVKPILWYTMKVWATEALTCVAAREFGFLVSFDYCVVHIWFYKFHYAIFPIFLPSWKKLFFDFVIQLFWESTIVDRAFILMVIQLLVKGSDSFKSFLVMDFLLWVFILVN